MTPKPSPRRKAFVQKWAKGIYAALMREQLDALIADEQKPLVEALEGLMWRFEDDDRDPFEPSEVAPDVAKARAALAAVKGE